MISEFQIVLQSQRKVAWNLSLIRKKSEGHTRIQHESLWKMMRIKKMVMQAYSIGGGRIRVSVLDGIEVDFSGESNTLIVRNMDRPGCITEVSAALSHEKINVATMQVFRHKRGGSAVMVVETDQFIPENVVNELKKKEDILEVISLNLEEGR